MLEDAVTQTDLKPKARSNDFTCENCMTIGNLITDNFQHANRDYMLEKLLYQCGQMSSFSDACSNIVLTHFNDLYGYTNQTLSGSAICHMSGACSLGFHEHPERQQDAITVEQLQKKIRPVDEIVVKEDIPCDLCKQLVQHLK